MREVNKHDKRSYKNFGNREWGDQVIHKKTTVYYKKIN